MKAFSFGEVLWDDFGDSREIGGAPLNLAAHLCRIGIPTGIVSAVGDDELGRETADIIRSLSVSDELLSVNSYPTGLCRVSQNDKGFPAYEIVENSAYDNLTLGDTDIELLDKADLFCFGTLAQRGQITLKTLDRILEQCSFKHVFCDLNIRQKYYDKDSILRCLEYCDILKISREEAGVLFETGILEGDGETLQITDLEKICRALAEKYNIKIILMTLDKDGAMVYNLEDDRVILSRRPEGRAVSTVGAGDSFCACFLAHYLKGANIAVCLDKAVTLSNYVVTKLGAVPDYSDELKDQICLD